MGFLAGLKRRQDNEEVPQVLLTGRQPLHAPDFPLALLFSPKAGCTSFTKWFFFQTGKLEEALAYAAWIHRYRTDVWMRQKGYAAESLRLLQTRERPIVKLVRNPYDRAVSSFLHTVRGAGHSSGGTGWERLLVQAIRERAGRPNGEVLRLSFRDFLRHVAAVGTAVGKINGHVARQYLPGEEAFISRVIKLENFVPEIRRLETEYGLREAPLEELSSSVHHISSGDQTAVGAFSSRRAPADMQIGRSRVLRSDLPSYGDFYDAETERLAHECFAADFEHYDYPRRLPDQGGD